MKWYRRHRVVVAWAAIVALIGNALFAGVLELAATGRQRRLHSLADRLNRASALGPLGAVGERQRQRLGPAWPTSTKRFTLPTGDTSSRQTKMGPSISSGLAAVSTS